MWGARKDASHHIRELRDEAFRRGKRGQPAFFHLSVIVDEKKTGQTSDVSEKASKRFKVLKYSTRRLVYQQTRLDSKRVYCAM